MKEESLHRLAEKIRLNIVPFSVVFEITDRCNLRCLHCYQGKAPRGTLDLAGIKSVLDDLAELGTLKLTLTGGEPTLREDLVEIYSYCHSKGLATTLFTNGTFLGRRLKHAILENPPLLVECSLYGASPEIHDRITGTKGSFDATLGNIRWMVEKGVPVLAKTVILSLNFSDVQPLEDLCRRLGISLQHTVRVFPSLDSARCPEKLRISTDRLKAVGAGRQRPFSLDSGNADALPEGFICNAGRQACCISPEGKVYPCVALRWECGDVKEKPFSEIWFRSPVLERIRAYSEEDFEECLRCDWKQRCDFCPGMGFSEHGNMLIPATEMCRLTKADH